MMQTFHEMSGEEIARLEAQRSWVRDHYEPHARSKYDSIEGKLALLDAILANGWVQASGDALAQRLGLRWVTVEDEYGRDPALKLDGTSVVTFPLTAISKRAERGERIDVYALFESACSSIGQAARDGA